MNEHILPRHIHWRQHYRKQRYARHLSQSELNNRIRDLVLNLLLLTPDAKVGLLPVNDATEIWMEKFTHAAEEMFLRHGPYPRGFTKEIFASNPLPAFASELAQKAARKMSSLGIKKGEVLIKFGKRQHMENLLKYGKLRIQPATYFGDSSHIGAVRDDEISIDLSSALSRNDVLALVINPQDVPAKIPAYRLDAQIVSPTDYWLYCLTNSVEARLFVDFQADSCVVINDRTKFGEMLRVAAERHLVDTTYCEGHATYIDPILAQTAKLFVPLVKHFRYSYQDEYRFGWMPRAATKKLEHVDIELGCLAEIADLIVL